MAAAPSPARRKEASLHGADRQLDRQDGKLSGRVDALLILGRAMSDEEVLAL